MAAAAPESSQGSAPYLLPSASRRSDGIPRFTLALDPALATSDHGLRYLIQQETRFDGFERATREVIDAHLKPGDLFIDAGAHVGAISLSAAMAGALGPAAGGDNPVLAIEPAPDNLRQLAASIAANGMGQRITIVPAALAAVSGKSRLRLTRGSMGYRLAADDASNAAIDVDVFSLDDLLARFPQHDQRRVVLKIDVEGQEAEVLQGAQKLLASGRLRLIIWEKFAAAPAALQTLLAILARHGFASFMFAFHDWGGPLIPFVTSPAIGNVFSFAPGEHRLASYPRDIARRPPHDVAHGMPPAQEHLLAYVEALRQAGGSDGSRWSNWQALEPGSVERAKAAAAFVPPGAHLLDLGAGRMELRRRMPLGARYQPADLVAWSADCQTVDLNYGPFPAGHYPGGHYEVIAALGLLEYLQDPAALIAAARSAAYRLIVTYPIGDSQLPVLARRGYGWMNDIDLAGFESMLATAGWRIAHRRPLLDSQFWVCEAGPA
ncbi:MAG TPA: FkbM family methyltransferase [Dongiaceae bacterium]